MEDNILLELKDIHVHHGGDTALNGISMYLNEGEVVVLIGTNGAGKSTTLKTIFGISSMKSGKILWHGKNIIPNPKEMVERGISYVPQDRGILKTLTVKENLEIGGYTVQSSSEVKRRIDEVLKMFPEFKEKMEKKSGQLSGGQQQMLAIARGLMTDPKVLLLDEPSLGIAPKVVKEVFKKIKEINDHEKTSIMIVEHNLKSISKIAHRAYVFDKGKIVAEGNTQKLMTSGILEKVFSTKKLAFS